MTPLAWWQTRRYVAVVALLSVLPLLWPSFAPLVDMPGHIGRYRILAEAGVGPLARHFEVHWALIGNLGVDLLVLALHPLLDVEPATRLVVTAIPLLTVLAMLWVAREAHGRLPASAGFALPLAYSFSFQLGFVNFCLAAALAIAGLALWLRLARTTAPALRALLFAPIACLVWVCHSFGWAMLGLFVWGAELQLRRAAGQGWLRAGVTAALMCAPMALPLAFMLAGGRDALSGDTGDWFNWIIKAQWVASLLRERWRPYDAGCAIVLLCVLWTAIRAPRWRFAPVLGTPALLGIAMFVLLPRLFQGGSYVDMRLLPPAVALALLAIRVDPGQPALERRLALAANAFFALRMLTTTIAFALYGHGQAVALRALPALPIGSAVLTLVNEPNSSAWSHRRFTHLAGIAIARRRVFVNEQWALAGQQLVHPLHPEAAPFTADPSQIVHPADDAYASTDLRQAIATFDRCTFTSVWTIGFPLGAIRAADLVPVWSDGQSAVYRVIADRSRCLSAGASALGTPAVTQGATTAPHWWQTRGFVAAMAFVAVVPLLWPTIPPLVDLPGHMGRYRVQLAIGTHPWLADWYDFRWQLIGNLGIDLLIVPLAKLMGLELAVKLVVLTIPALTVTGLLWIAREVHGRIPATALFALPLAYSYPFQFGFVNFALSMAVALNLFAWWLRLARQGRLGYRAALFAPLSCLLWLCHTFGWGVLGVLAFSAEMVRQHDRGHRWLGAWVRAGLGCLPLALPMLLMIFWRSGDHVSGVTGDWFHWQAKVRWMTMVLRDRWLWFDTASTAVLYLILFRSFRDPSIEYSRALGLSALFLLAVFILLPRVVFGSAYADMRLGPFAIAIALIAIRPRPGLSIRHAATLAALGLAFFVVRMGAATLSYWMFDRTYTRELAGLDTVPVGARLVTFVGQGCNDAWKMTRLEHMPGLALERRMAYANDQWSMAGAQLLTTRYTLAGRFAHDPSELVTPVQCRREWWRPVAKSLATFPRDAFDYVWLVAPPTYDRKLEAGLVPIWRSGRSAVFRIDHAHPGPQLSALGLVPPRYLGGTPPL